MIELDQDWSDRASQIMDWLALIDSVDPVMKPAPSPARNTTARVIYRPNSPLIDEIVDDPTEFAVAHALDHLRHMF